MLRGIYDYDIDCVENRKIELLDKYPYAAAEILKALSISEKIPNLSPEQVQDLLNPDDLLKKFATKVQN